jgi:hypothetical protein
VWKHHRSANGVILHLFLSEHSSALKIFRMSICWPSAGHVPASSFLRNRKRRLPTAPESLQLSSSLLLYPPSIGSSTSSSLARSARNSLFIPPRALLTSFAEHPAVHIHHPSSPHRLLSKPAHRPQKLFVGLGKLFVLQRKPTNLHRASLRTLAALTPVRRRCLLAAVSGNTAVTVSARQTSRHLSTLSHTLLGQSQSCESCTSSKIQRRPIGSYPHSTYSTDRNSSYIRRQFTMDKTLQPEGYTFPDRKLRRVLSNPTKTPLVLVACGR